MLTWLNRDHKNRRAREGYQNWRADNPSKTSKANPRFYGIRLTQTVRALSDFHLEYLDLTKDMTQDRAQWRSKIHIADPTQ
ncbi:unnamed protein product [Malus baccata var. baccata]